MKSVISLLLLTISLPAAAAGERFTVEGEVCGAPYLGFEYLAQASFVPRAQKVCEERAPGTEAQAVSGFTIAPSTQPYKFCRHASAQFTCH